MALTLSPTARAGIDLFLQEFPATTRKRGQRYFEDGRVVQIAQEMPDEEDFSAVVRGSQNYEIVLEWEQGLWDGWCSCPLELDCKHIYAAFRELQRVAVEAPELEAKRPGKKGKATVKAVAKLPAKPKAPKVKSEFVLELEAKIGRSLKADEEALAQRIVKLPKSLSAGGEVTEPALVGLFRKAKDWGWNRYLLWPEPPTTPWDTWLYLAHFLTQQGEPWPEFLRGITTTAEVEAQVASWERSRWIDRWKSSLEEAHRGSLHTKVSTVDLRAIFDERGVQLEASENDGPWTILKHSRFTALERSLRYGENKLTPEARSLWYAFSGISYDQSSELLYASVANQSKLQQLVRNGLLAPRLLNESRLPFQRPAEPLQWKVEAPENPQGDYRFLLQQAEGTPVPNPRLVLPGQPTLYLTADAIFQAPALGDLPLGTEAVTLIPAPALETRAGVSLLANAGVELPARVVTKVQRHKARLVFQAELVTAPYGGGERVQVKALADWGGAAPEETLRDDTWTVSKSGGHPGGAAVSDDNLVIMDRSALESGLRLISGLNLSWNNFEDVWERKIGKPFPEQFSQWLMSLPDHVELRLDRELASLREGPLKGSVQLDVEPAGTDWFDLSVALSVPDLELTREELQALLSANGGWVRLGKAGWRRLALQLSEEEDRDLADLGLSPRDLASGEKQRLHALQLAHAGADRMLTVDRVAELRARAADLKARVAPAIPTALSASLRPYQVEGYHFLAYLSENHFGGLLADDMGLGKTLQTLTWMLWLRSQPEFKGAPSLVVCPKSVMDNWRSEARRFAPHLRVLLWRGREESELPAIVRDECDVLVINYAQLRNLRDGLTAIPWQAVILDEAQAIKNPDAQSSRAACSLQAEHRLALTGTPIENRLLDLWSIMAFAMPGMLGNRSRFGKVYDQKDDPLARRRLAARTRPFLLRRTKEQVARDLPDKVEEDLLCEIEGPQATLYQAELKRARKALLGLETDRELDKVRFHILTSLLRLRQICCHPGLVDPKALEKPSAKTEALLDLLEPLMEEGRKVLVFSQFVGVIEILQKALEARGWPIFILTGQTEDRGELIERFQATEGQAVFLLSLKASSFGLNLTAASYVVLYDPWWNPAVENQAIDRTHRIGQTSTVFAYRLLVKGSIEEKIRSLQKQKRALAEDLLGEEAFARALTLSDLRMLLDDPGSGEG